MGLFNRNTVYEYMDLNRFHVSLFSELYISLLVIDKYFGNLYNDKEIGIILNILPFKKWYETNKKLYGHSNFSNDLVNSQTLLFRLKKCISDEVLLKNSKRIKLSDIDIKIQSKTFTLRKILDLIDDHLNYIQSILPRDSYGQNYSYTLKKDDSITHANKNISPEIEIKLKKQIEESIVYLRNFLRELIKDNLEN